MNIGDVKEIPEPLTVDSMFKRQKELMEIYKDIEGRHEPLNLDTREGQQVVKDFLWRITEEVGEALDSNLGPEHVKEEFVDGLHFLLELAIITGREDDVKKAIEDHGWFQNDPFNMDAEGFIVCLAIVGRVCKNKPWKQTQIPLDQIGFTVAMERLTRKYFQNLECHFDSLEEVCSYYLRKSKVNQFRQQSGY